MAVEVGARRAKVSATVAADLLEQVDRFVADRPGTSRSAVIDEALRLWTARERERAMEEQYADLSPLSADDAAEWESWRAIQRASAAHLFRDRCALPQTLPDLGRGAGRSGGRSSRDSRTIPTNPDRS